MKIESLKDLEAVLKLCRKQGVTNFTIDGMSCSLGDAPDKQPKDGVTETKEAPPYSDEDLIDWSSQGAQ